MLASNDNFPSEKEMLRLKVNELLAGYQHYKETACQPMAAKRPRYPHTFAESTMSQDQI